MKNFVFILICTFTLRASATDVVVLNLLVWDTYAPREKIEVFRKTMLKKHNVAVKLNVKTALSPHDFFESVRNRSIDIFCTHP
jgi:hypothetical protein